ncbi:MAG: DUF3604 domain-containing protein [Nostocaceae cyanobacterium]|nr:DUF3604 domain-containing protein [Nostocaceae cyanobacterium]
MGNILFASSSALAVSLPPGEYEDVGQASPSEYGYDYPPYAGGRTFPQQVFWGDTHMHTIYSFDAGAAGTTLTPEDSYRFARGEEVTADGGQKVRLSRPLDFLVVTDHSDQLGSFSQFVDAPPQDCGEDQAQIDEWHTAIIAGGEAAAQAANEITADFAQGKIPACMLQSKQDFKTAWHDEIKWAEQYNDPYLFTAFIGYEWTSLASGDNLHRNVIFRDNWEKAYCLTPKTTEDGTNPELLWKWMQDYETNTGGNVLAIPHNGNLSNGLMFADNMFADNTNPDGLPLTADYAQRRQLWEPLYEVIQMKGAGETHPSLSPDDEFASFEIAGWDNGNLDLSHPKTKDMYEHEYARAALKNGLKFEDNLGTNPFKFGLVGSTDSHIGITGVEENSFMGKFPIYTPSPERAAHVSKTSCFTKDENGECVVDVQRFGWQYGAAGHVGVWARENTRESLFDAMERREVYATSGPRMVVRLFGGWDFTDEDLGRNPGDVGYAKGVPMGSDLDLNTMQVGQAPTFLVAALKDPIRGNLDRIQIVKGWLDANGETQEKVYDVVWSGDRTPDSTTGKLPPVGNTVNTDTAEWTNTIGATELATVWTDPNFDPSQRAFYYARVLEIPTPRWTDYDKAFFSNADIPQEAPLTLQERVYTAPIWYSPAEVAMEPTPQPTQPTKNVSHEEFWNRIIQEVEKHYSIK